MVPTMLDYALKYRRMGFSVIPCKKDKRPLLKWEPYQLQKPTEAEIKEWWGKWPDANIAVVCGQVSGVDVLDCDSQEAYDNVNNFYLSESFQTPTVKTPKGRHLYFKHRSGLTNQVQAIKGTDIRTFGGYVIAPPSKNGSGNAYYWFDGLKPNEIDVAAWPDELFATLQAVSNNNIYNSSCLAVTSNSKDRARKKEVSTTVYKYFEQGRRDQDIFHVANCLVKGHCEKDLVLSVLNILAKNCNPPFDEKEIETKFNSASMRQNVRNRNLASEVKEWILSTNGDFLSTDVYKDLQLSTRDERKNLSIILKRLEEKEKLIESIGTKNGQYRLRDQDCKPEDWLTANCDYRDLWLPLGLGEICGVLPGNILLFAGSKDAGKTAFLMNTAKENRHRYKIHYINSEMGHSEFLKRVKLFDDISPEQFSHNFNFYTKSSNFHDYVQPGEGNLNIIDYLEAPDEVWKIGQAIRKIHDKLEGSICLIGIQKKTGQDLGRGAEFSMEKARLYVSLEYGNAKIISCKNFKENDLIKGSPRGYSCKYKLVNGCRIVKQPPGWASQLEEKKE